MIRKYLIDFNSVSQKNGKYVENQLFVNPFVGNEK